MDFPHQETEDKRDVLTIILPIRPFTALIMRRLGEPTQLIDLDSDTSACRLDITNMESVSITGRCLTIDFAGMYPAMLDYSPKYEW